MATPLLPLALHQPARSSSLGPRCATWDATPTISQRSGHRPALLTRPRRAFIARRAVEPARSRASPSGWGCRRTHLPAGTSPPQRPPKPAHPDRRRAGPAGSGPPGSWAPSPSRGPEERLQGRALPASGSAASGRRTASSSFRPRQRFTFSGQSPSPSDTSAWIRVFSPTMNSSAAARSRVSGRISRAAVGLPDRHQLSRAQMLSRAREAVR